MNSALLTSSLHYFLGKQDENKDLISRNFLSSSLHQRWVLCSSYDCTVPPLPTKLKTHEPSQHHKVECTSRSPTIRSVAFLACYLELIPYLNTLPILTQEVVRVEDSKGQIPSRVSLATTLQNSNAIAVRTVFM